VYAASDGSKDINFEAGVYCQSIVAFGSYVDKLCDTTLDGSTAE
jgi:hypothetical protein